MPAHEATKVNFWDVISRIMIFVIIATGTAVISHEIRLSKIEVNRFTDQDGRHMEDRLLQKLPPQWLRDDLIEVKEMLRHAHEEREEIRERLVVLEQKK